MNSPEKAGLVKNVQPIRQVRTLVLGIGNMLRKDDGVGIHVIERLRGMGLPAGTRLLDGGTAGIDIIAYLEDVDRLIIVDALLAEADPGEIRLLDEDAITGEDYFISGHFGRIGDMLDMAAAMWGRPEVVVVGIVPGDCDSYEVGLSPEVAGAVDNAAACVMRIINTTGPTGRALPV